MSPQLGDTVKFKDKWNRDVEGVVVNKVTFPVSPGANSYTVYAKDSPYGTPTVYGLRYSSIEIVANALKPAKVLRETNEHYKAFMAQYPVSAERFEQDPHYWMFR